MDIYSYTGLDKKDEVTSKRGERYKVFKTGRNKYRYITTTCPVHYSSNGWHTIDASLNLVDVNGKEYQNQYLMDKNRFSVGFRGDKDKSKFYGIRLDDNHQFEVTASKIRLDDDVLNIPDKFPEITKSDNNTILHKILDDVYLYTRLSHVSVRSAIMTTRWIQDFEIKELINIKGFEVTNSMSGNSYIPNSRNEFIIVAKNNPNDKLRIPNPMMWNDVDSCRNITHTLVSSNGYVIYSKYPTDKGKEWLVTRSPPFYLDGTTYTSETSDGYVALQSAGDWTDVRYAPTGNFVGDSDNSHNQAVKAWFSKMGGCSVTRSFFYFDTSGIDVDASINTATFYIYGTASGNSVDDTTCTVERGTQSGSLSIYDYDELDLNHNNYKIYGIFNQTSGDGDTKWNVNDWNICVIDGSTDVPSSQSSTNGYNEINKSGITKICCRNYTYDYLAVEPTTTGNELGITFADNGSNEPYLDITFDAPLGEDSTIFQGSGDMSFFAGGRLSVFKE